MGALHDGHRALVRAARAELPTSSSSASSSTRCSSAPARTSRATRARCDADLALCARPARRPRLRAGRRRRSTRRASRGRVDAGPLGERARGRVAARALRRRAHRRRQAVRPGAARTRRLRREGRQQLALVRRMVADLDLAPSIVGGADRARRRRPGAVQPQPVPRRRRSERSAPSPCPRRAARGPRRRRPRAAPSAGPGRGTRRCSTRSPASTVDYLAARRRPGPVAAAALRPTARPAGRGPGRDRTRLIDNATVDLAGGRA